MKKRKDKRYVKTIQTNYKRKYIYAKTQTELAKKVKQYKNSFKQININNAYKSLNKWLSEWFELYKKPFVAIDTQKDIKNIIFNHLKNFGNIELKNITTKNTQIYLNRLPNNRTKEKIMLYLNEALEKARVLKKIKSNPFEDIVKPKKLNNKKRPFTYAEQVKVLNRLQNEEIKPIILFYLVTGLRKEELNIKHILEDISEDTKVLKAINLKQHDNKIHYKYIDLTQKTIDMVKANILTFKKNSTNSVYRRFRKILNELHIYDCAIHTLRFTFASNHYVLGTPDKYISTWLGHSTTAITKDVYIQIEDREITKDKIKLLYNNLYYEIWPHIWPHIF